MYGARIYATVMKMAVRCVVCTQANQLGKVFPVLPLWGNGVMLETEVWGGGGKRSIRSVGKQAGRSPWSACLKTINRVWIEGQD